MKNIIFEALVAEAQFRVVEHINRGVAIDEAISEVAREMELEGDEVQELTTRAKKAPSIKQPIEIDDTSNVEIIEEATPHQIKFSDGQELDAALGVLMYKSIPWTQRGTDFVTFANADDVAKAHDALKRRWDFINAEDLTVATIGFDNIQDYNKVLDFIASKNMTVMMDSAELSQDLDLQMSEDVAAHKKAVKAAKEAGLDAPEAPAQELSYRAMHKDKLVDTKALDPVSDSAARSIRVVKRWK